MSVRGHSNSAHAGLGGGGVIKMRANACMGEGGVKVMRVHALASAWTGDIR